jgi:hypothetical protein
MSTVNEYQAYARDCLRWAAKAPTEEQRRQFLSLASDWTHAAAGLEGGLANPRKTARGETLSKIPRFASDEAE